MEEDFEYLEEVDHRVERGVAQALKIQSVHIKERIIIPLICCRLFCWGFCLFAFRLKAPRTSRRQVGHVCCRWNQDRRHAAWKIWPHGSFFALKYHLVTKKNTTRNYLDPGTISSRQIIQVLSFANSSSVAFG